MSILTEAEDFKNVQDLLAKSFNIHENLPEQVFKAHLTQFIFLEFDLIRSSLFWSGLQFLFQVGGDNLIFLAVLDPDPQAYYFHHFNRYPVIRISPTDSESDYGNDLHSEPPGSPADSIASNSTIVTLIGDSGKWAIWADRDYDIGILAFDKSIQIDTLPSLAESLLPLSLDKALNSLICFSFRGYVTPSEWSDRFIKNYVAATT